MTGLLASVRSAAEAALAVVGGADIIDAKEPAAGALGRVESSVLRAILREVAGRRPVSATIGDLDLSPSVVSAAVEATAADGADIVKIGVFPGALEATWAALQPLARRGLRLVAVMFADRAPNLVELPARCAEAGFFGVMLDTADKAAGPLSAHLDRKAVAGFVARARSLGLASGLAGSLRLGDIPSLVPLGANYLGFRSALTIAGRSSGLDAAVLRAVRAALDQAAPSRESSRATATAGAISEASERKLGLAAMMLSPKSR
jgi:(5-formylfuran-3-yl)methyl phosphate synthase